MLTKLLSCVIVAGLLVRVESSDIITVCRTDKCKEIAEILHEGRNQSVDPCDNFYEYACGNWAAKHPTPPGEIMAGIGHVMKEHVKLRLKGLLLTESVTDKIRPITTDASPITTDASPITTDASPITTEISSITTDASPITTDASPITTEIPSITTDASPITTETPRMTNEASPITNETPPITTESPSITNEISLIKQARESFKLCMDTQSIDAKGFDPIRSILSNIGGWPMAMNENDWNEAEYPWKKVNRYFAEQAGEYYLWGVYRVSDGNGDGFSKRVKIYPKEGPMENSITRMGYEPGKPSAYWENYRSVISDVVELFAKKNGVIIEKDKLHKDTTELIEFENQLVNKLYWAEYPRSESVDDNDEHDDDPKSRINWEKIVRDLFKIVGSTADHDIDWNSFSRTWTNKLQLLLMNTPQRIVVNYLHWRFIESTWQYTNGELFEMLEECCVWKKRAKVDRFLFCMESIKMPEVIQYYYGQKYWTEYTEKSAISMINNLRSTYIDEIDDSTWLDNNARNTLKLKTNDIKFRVAFPDWYKNETMLIEKYKGLSIGKSFFEDQLIFKKLLCRKSFEDNTKKASTWREPNYPPWRITAFADKATNYLEFSEPFFDVPMFSTDYPEAVNYGRVGSIIGHEISHRFDPEGICGGSSIDKTDLSTEAITSYYNRTDCFVHQFNEYHGNTNKAVKPLWPCRPRDKDNKYRYPWGPRTHGEYTAQEDISDTTGLHASLRAFIKSYHNIRPKHVKKLPYFEDFSEEKLFFLSFANYHCEAYAVKDRPPNPHSEGKLRVNGAVSNTPEFATAFNCPAKAPMNPINKCKIWGN